MAEEQENKRFDYNRLRNWAKRDLVYIIACVFCLGAAMYTLYYETDYNKQCNEHWVAEFSRLQCPGFEQPNQFTNSYNPVFYGAITSMRGNNT